MFEKIASRFQFRYKRFKCDFEVTEEQKAKKMEGFVENNKMALDNMVSDIINIENRIVDIEKKIAEMPFLPKDT